MLSARSSGPLAARRAAATVRAQPRLRRCAHSVAAELDRRATVAPHAPALIVPHQGVHWSYHELRDKARSLATGLQVTGFCTGDAVMMWLPSVAENVLVQLAAAINNIRVVTVKDADGMAKLEGLQCKGLITSLENHLSSGKAAPTSAIIPPVVTGTENVTGDFLRFAELLTMGGVSAAPPLGGGLEGPDQPMYFYNSSNGMSQTELIDAGDAAAVELALTPADRLCLPVTLNHSFGFGSGALAAFRSGAALVLPSAAPSPQETVAAIKGAGSSEGCTVLYADTHTLNALIDLEESAASDGVGIPDSFRGGLVKIGSGDDFGLAEPRHWAGCAMITVGKPK